MSMRLIEEKELKVRNHDIEILVDRITELEERLKRLELYVKKLEVNQMKVTKEIKDFCIRWIYNDYQNVYYNFMEKFVQGSGDIGFRIDEKFGVYSDELNPYIIRHPFLDELMLLLDKYEKELEIK